MRLGQRPADRQAQAQARGRRRERVLALLEGLEDPGQDLRLDADAGVADLDDQRGAVRRCPGPPALRERTVIVPPAGVNLTAFLIRFQTTCWSRAGSASTWCAGAARSRSSSSPPSPISPRQISTAWRIDLVGVDGAELEAQAAPPDPR